MAGQTHSLFERLMFYISAAFQRSAIMTHHAECAAALHRFKRLLGSGGIVARPTGASKDRAMRARLEELRLRRGMRIMTTRTGFRLNRIPSVGLLERRIAALMTGQAEGSR